MADDEVTPPGVLGLVVGPQNLGYVVPLTCWFPDDAAYGNGPKKWDVPTTLPFAADEIVRLVAEVCRVLISPTVPESLTVRFEDGFGGKCDGGSMTIAGLLSFVRSLNPDAALLDSAVAVCELEGTSGMICRSDSVSAKLDAFVREFGTGTLLIRETGCADSARYSDYFDVVWEIKSVFELSGKLKDARLLGALESQGCLRLAEVLRLLAELEVMVNSDHRYSHAVDLTERVLHRDWSAVPDRFRKRVESIQLDARRHQGTLDADHKALLVRHATGELDDEVFAATVDIIAMLYDQHRFEEMETTLCAKRDELGNSQVRAFTKSKLLNTLARSRVAQGQPTVEWEPLYRESLVLQQETAQRTRNYLIHGLLRASELDSAEDEIAASGTPSNDFSRQFLGFFRAELARRRGLDWLDDEQERLLPPPSGVLPDNFYVTAFYLLAVARQPNIDSPGARLRTAADIFFQLSEQAGTPSVLDLLGHVAALAAESMLPDGDGAGAWQRLLTYFDNAPRTIAGFYADVIEPRDVLPSRVHVERILDCVPYF